MRRVATPRGVARAFARTAHALRSLFLAKFRLSKHSEPSHAQRSEEHTTYYNKERARRRRIQQTAGQRPTRNAPVRVEKAATKEDVCTTTSALFDARNQLGRDRLSAKVAHQLIVVDAVLGLDVPRRHHLLLFGRFTFARHCFCFSIPRCCVLVQNLASSFERSCGVRIMLCCARGFHANEIYFSKNV